MLRVDSGVLCRGLFVRAFALMLWCCLLAVCAWAQGFELSVVSPQPLSGTLKLSLYKASGECLALRPVASSSTSCLFEGSLAGPMYAELSGASLPRPMPIFLEEGSATVALNIAEPEKSHVNGSRTNSLYRYALELVDSDTSAFGDLIRSKPTEPYLAAALCHAMPHLTLAQAKGYKDVLQGEACHAFHYQLIEKQLSALAASSEGSPLKDFIFVDERGGKVHLDSLISDTLPTVIFVSATWCEQCETAHRNLTQLARGPHPFRLLTLLVDRQPKGWEAPCLRTLSVDYIPNLILLDKNQIVFARDFRYWETARLLNDMNQ